MAILRAMSSPYDLDESIGGYFHNTPAGVAADVQDHITLRNAPNVAGALFAKRSSLWMGFSLQKSDTSSLPDRGLVDFYDTNYSTTQPLYRIKKLNTNNSNTRLFMWNGTAWVDNGAAIAAMNGTTMKRIDLELVMAAENGVFRLHIDGVSIAEIAGNTNPTNSEGIDKITLYNHAGNPNNSDNVRTTFSGIIIADEDTRPLFLAQRKPTGDGHYTQWIGGWEDVLTGNPNGLPADGTSISSGAPERRQSFPYASIEAYEFNPVKAVAIAHRCRESELNTAPVAGFIRSGGVDIDGGGVSAGTAFSGKQTIITGLNYGDLQGAEFGVKTVSP